MPNTITAIAPTLLKKAPVQGFELGSDQKVDVNPGRQYGVNSIVEIDGKEEMGGHMKVELTYEAGEWWIWPEHWVLPWTAPPQTGGDFVYPDWDQINWYDNEQPISKYFTVGEATLRDPQRIPTEQLVMERILAIAKAVDPIREEWGHPFTVNSYYRPWDVNASVGSSAPNHPNGWAIDFGTSGGGGPYALQEWFTKEWWDTGRWQHGYGMGANKGFIHLDLDWRRVWNY